MPPGFRALQPEREPEFNEPEEVAMTKRQERHEVGRTQLANADPAHAPGKQHIDLDEIRRRGRAGASQYARGVPVAAVTGRKAHERRGR